MTHVVLTGFMAVGKTAVGKRLARRLHRPFVDLDAMIEQREGMAVSAIFEKHGEKYFREVESEVVASLDPPKPSVISTGGGTFTDEENRARLQKLGVTVCLVSGIDTILERVLRNDKRPLAQGPDARERLIKLFEERMPSYRKADVLIETDSLSIEQSVVRVMTIIEPRLRKDRETA